MRKELSDEGMDLLFRQARTHTAWLNKPVDDDTLHRLYNLMKFGPTSANMCPARIVFVRTKEAKERLRPALMAGNVDKTMAAPVTAIVGYDQRFYDLLPRLFPAVPTMRDLFANSPQLAETSAFRNGSLQGGYFILAARAVGLDCGPMSGFDNAKVDDEFFPAPRNEVKGDVDVMASGRIKSNFLCNLGYGDVSKLYPRNPRLEFKETCTIL